MGNEVGGALNGSYTGGQSYYSGNGGNSGFGSQTNPNDFFNNMGSNTGGGVSFTNPNDFFNNMGSNTGGGGSFRNSNDFFKSMGSDTGNSSFTDSSKFFHGMSNGILHGFHGSTTSSSDFFDGTNQGGNQSGGGGHRREDSVFNQDINTRKYGCFVSSSNCGCAKENKKISQVLLRSGPLTNVPDNHKTNEKTKRKGYEFSHQFLVFKYKCCSCGMFGEIVIEYSKIGIEFSHGNYQVWFPTYHHREKTVNNVSFATLQQKVEKVKREGSFDASSFNTKRKNCHHFAKQLFDEF
jgi:hypothetical protein